MSNRYTYPTLVMNIKREFFAAILSTPRRKHVEYRALSPYWIRRLEKVGPAPFRLRFLNGMTAPIPEATVLVKRVVRYRRSRALHLHLGRVVEVKHWDRRRECPTS